MDKKVKCQVYSRVCGYYAPVETRWNAGKEQEFKERLEYDEDISMESLREAAEGKITRIEVFTMPMCGECLKVKEYFNVTEHDFDILEFNFKQYEDLYLSRYRKYPHLFTSDAAPAVLIYRNDVLSQVVHDLKGVLDAM